MLTHSFAMLRRTAVRLAIIAVLFPGAKAAAQHCVIPPTSPTLAVRAAAGTEWGGEGTASGGTIALHGRRWFVAGEYTDRGFALGRRVVLGPPGNGRMESQHQVLGVRAGRVNPFGSRSAFCLSGGYGMGTGMSVQSYGDPMLGGSGFESHRRFRADVEFVREVNVGGVRLIPAASAGLMLIWETELQGDIMLQGPHGYAPITFTLGMPLGDAFALRARVNAPPGRSRGSSFGVDAVVQFGRAYRASQRTTARPDA